jgi:hypothetical protein
MSASSHGYTLCDGHQDEDLSSIEKRNDYKRIWQWNYRFCQLGLHAIINVCFAKEEALILA